jgi:hypothetical protein
LAAWHSDSPVEISLQVMEAVACCGNPNHGRPLCLFMFVLECQMMSKITGCGISRQKRLTFACLTFLMYICLLRNQAS